MYSGFTGKENVFVVSKSDHKSRGNLLYGESGSEEISLSIRRLIRYALRIFRM